MVACNECAYCSPTPGGSLYCALTDHFVPNLGCEHGEPINKAKSNGDRIRSMTDHDLADWIARVLTYHGSYVADEYHVDCNTDCPLYKCCNDQPYDNIEDWLKIPVKEEVTE